MNRQYINGFSVFAVFLLLFLASLSLRNSPVAAPEIIAKKGNHLVGEKSTYLSQHAHNAVDWYPWGPEAFARARREHKPIHLSIGYSSCHWCHAMDKESFQDLETAKLMNEKFINVLVDREQRPDIDRLYLRAVVQLGGSAGWPLTLFLTPDLKPFFGGNYYPKLAGLGRPAFKDVLNRVASNWTNKEKDLRNRAQICLDAVKEMDQSTPEPEQTEIQDQALAQNQSGSNIAAEGKTKFISPDQILQDQGSSLLSYALNSIYRNFDPKYGGFGYDRKAPNVGAMNFFMRGYNEDLMGDAIGNHRCLEVFSLTLRQTACSGIHDLIDGGFHRFTVDWKWRVPHFEKMLYDNALFASTYMNASLLSNKKCFENAARDAADFMLTDLRSPDGAFYSSLQSDTKEGEGKYYVFSSTELKSCMSADDADWLCKVLNITPKGNYEGNTSVVSFSAPPEELARQLNMSYEEFQNKFSGLRAKLRELRSKRVKPAQDQSIVCSWNAMAISGLARVYAGTGDKKYLEAAKEAAHFILTKLSSNGELHHTFVKEVLSGSSYLEDYAWSTQAFLDLAEVDTNPLWLQTARKLNDEMLKRFWGGKKRFSYAKESDLPITTEDYLDSSMPSSTSVAVLDLLRMELLTGQKQFGEMARSTLVTLLPRMRQRPVGTVSLLCDLDFAIAPPLEIIVVSNNAASELDEMRKKIFSIYLPNKAMALINEDQLADYPSSIALNRKSPQGKSSAYLCCGPTCKSPIINADQLFDALK